MNPVTRAAIYLRQSIDLDGDQAAVTRQRQDCRKIAGQRGWTVVAEYLDNNLSASDRHKQRPRYEAMVKAYERGEFSAIICWDLDRLTRQPRQLEDWIDAAEDKGLQLVTANGEADLGTDGGRMYARIKAAVARAEMERKGARQRRAALQRAEDGKPPLAQPLLGYTTSGEVIEHEAAVVREAFARFAAGDSLLGVVKWLDGTGVTPRRRRPSGDDRPWWHSTVRRMLTNPRYCGRAVYCGQENGHRGNWEAIVDEATFDAVGRKLADPRRLSHYGTDRKYLGGGLYLCGVCGDPVSSHASADSARCHRYRCKRGGHITRSGDQTDGYVLAVLRARLRRDDVADLLAPADTDKARELAAEVGSLRARLARAKADYLDDLIDGQMYQAKTAKLTAALDAAVAEQARELGSASLAGLLGADNPVAAFDRAPLGVQRAVIGLLCQVRLLPAPRGRKTFDPDTVRITGPNGEPWEPLAATA
jgi:site-specific DNA recombinase